MRAPIERVVMIRILGPNRERSIPRVNLNLRLIQALFGVRVLHRIDLHFVLVPTGNVHIAVDVIEFNPAIGGEGISLMEFLGQSAAVVGGMCREGKSKQGTNRSQFGL